MKKAIFFFAFFLAVGIVGANAQCSSAASAGKSCCANKAAKAASSDASIEKRQAEAIRTAFFAGLSYPELASRSAVPLGTMKSMIRRGLLRLRECLER